MANKRKYSRVNEWNDAMLDAALGVLFEPNTPAIDTFGRKRVSLPHTIFDSKLLNDNRPLFWDDQETSGSGTGSSYDSDRASVTISVSNATAGTRVRQTFQRFNYQPGKSHAIIITNVLGGGASGIIKRFGYFDGNNGLFFQLSGDTLSVGIRSNRSGTPTDTVVNQSNWNIDVLDGSGVSGVTIDSSKSNIYFIDLEWLGVGEVRFGVVVGGKLLYCHQQNHANTETGVYMTTPNLPIRYEITNDGTGPAANIEAICNTVISEGGQDVTGITRGTSTGGVHLSASVADTLYALIGVRLKAAYIDCVTSIELFSIIAETNDDFEWQLLLNPTVADTFAYSDVANSALQRALGATANTVTGGTILGCGFGKSGSSTTEVQKTLRYLGAAIDGTVDEIVLCVRPLTTNATIQGALNWREFA